MFITHHLRKKRFLHELIIDHLLTRLEKWFKVDVE